MRAALRPLLERKDAEHDERPIEEQQEQPHIDGQNGLEDAATPSLSKLLLQVDDAQEPRDHNPMMMVRMTPTTEASAHLSEPTWVTMILPSRLTLRPDSAALVANSPEHHHADEDRADDDAGQAEREDDLA